MQRYYNISILGCCTCSSKIHCPISSSIQATARSEGGQAKYVDEQMPLPLVGDGRPAALEGEQQPEHARPPSPQIEKPIEVSESPLLVSYNAEGLRGVVSGEWNVVACLQVMAYEACRDVMEALRAKYSGPLQVCGHALDDCRHGHQVVQQWPALEICRFWTIL